MVSTLLINRSVNLVWIVIVKQTWGLRTCVCGVGRFPRRSGREKRERPYDVWGVWHEGQDTGCVMSGLSVISPSVQDTCDQPSWWADQPQCDTGAGDWSPGGEERPHESLFFQKWRVILKIQIDWVKQAVNMTTYGFSRELTPRRKIDTPVSEVELKWF